MFKHIFRLTFLTFIWKKYKRVIVSTVLLLLFLWLVNFAHSEYLSFAKYQSEESNITLSFFVKWLSLILGAVIYLITVFWLPKKKIITKKNKDEAKLTNTGERDPFASIREKDQLRSRAEIMLEKNNHTKH